MFFIIAASSRSYSQDTIKYDYDAAGNRIARVISLLKSGRINNSNPQEETKQEIIKDSSFDGGAVRIYPNPTRGFVEIEIPDEVEKSEVIWFIVTNVHGKRIIDKRHYNNRTQIDLSSQPNGLYILNIKKGQVVSQWKIIKQ